MSEIDDFSKDVLEPTIEKIADQFVTHYKAGRESMKQEILGMLKGCLDRDPTLQMLYNQIEEIQ